MKKRIIAFLIVLVMVVPLFGCGGSSTTAPASPLSGGAGGTTVAPPIAATTAPSPERVVETSPDATVPDTTVQVDSHLSGSGSYIYKSSTGYEIEVTISVGKWIPATETALLESTWKKFGGRAPCPTTEEFNDNNYNEDYQWKYATVSTAFLFGNISLKNITPGFKITEDNPISFHPIMVLSGQFFIWVVDFSSHRIPYAYNINAKMTRDTWSCAFVAAAPNVFTPNYPDGDPAYDFGSFSTGGDGFVVLNTWRNYDSIDIPDEYQSYFAGGSTAGE